MKLRLVLPILLLLFSRSKPLNAQNLTGTWEGIMSQEFIQVNILQEKTDEFCGYTWDHFLNNKKNYCIAYFKGKGDTKQKGWVINGLSFIENSGSHELMHIKLWREKGDDINVLRALVSPKSAIGIIFSFGIREYVELRRVDVKPAAAPQNLPPCYQAINKPLADSTTSKATNDSLQALQLMIARRNNTISRIPVNVNHITLKVYDNATVDGDTVTIFYNGKLLVSKQRLSEKPIVIELDLDLKSSTHEITLYAENLGSIPPNTALLVVTAGDKRYELHAKSDLEENAVLIFEYRPVLK